MSATSTKPWYMERDDDALARSVFKTCDRIRREQYTARRLMLHHYELYSNQNASGLGQKSVPVALTSFWRGAPIGNLPGTSFNMCAAGADTVLSMIAQQPPLPIYQTSGDDLATNRKAEKKSKALQARINSLPRAVFADAAYHMVITGTGVIHQYLDEDGLPALEAVNPMEILIDHLDGWDKHPASIHRTKYRTKAWAIEQWPESEDEIRRANAGVVDPIALYLMPSGYGDLSEMIEIVESYAISGGKRIGEHTICCSEGVLLREKYTRTKHCYSFGRYRMRPFGFWGSGIVEACRPNQERVNHLIRKVARGQDLGSNLFIFSPENPSGQGVNPNFITTKVATIIPYDADIGTPTLAKWDGTMVDLQQQIDLEFERFLRAEGVSDQRVSGEGAGRGLSSAVAQRAADDIQNSRMFHPTERFEQMCLDGSELVADALDEIAQLDSGDLTEAAAHFVETSSWQELLFERGEANLSMFKMNSLPTTPQGKWASAQEWVAAGFVTMPMAIKVLQFPAIDAFAGLETAQIDLILRQMEDVVDGMEVLPLPRQPHELCLSLGTQVWARIMTMRPSEATEAATLSIEAYLDYAKAQLDRAKKQAASEQMAANPAAAMMGAAVAPEQQEAAALPPQEAAA